MTRIVVVLVTCPTPAVGRRLARELVRLRLAACVNVLPGVESVFRWQGKVDRSREALLVIKTTRARFAALRRRVLSLHPYDLPEVIALPVAAGHPPYLRWVASSV
jgi:periplasmic divalent cation tolerance protein